ncbi:flagellar biosynthesis protein FliQ [Planctomycetales bacterium ZRK34]|nr:flagellar biosynthesis protein FliQ [Planctomycetales bacterium ZRK34]
MSILRESMMVALMISGPILAVGLVVGLLISLFQAVTQIQEQTLTFVPKIVAMAVTVILIAPWLGTKILEFSARMFAP